LAVRWILDLLSALVWLAQGRRDSFRAVVRAHRDFRAMRRGDFAAEGERTPATSLRDKRRSVQSTRRATPRGVYRGSVVLAYLLGLRTFSRLRMR